MSLKDLNGAALAFGRSQFEFADPAYPRPDFDPLYNLARLAAEMGRQPLAERMAAGHHRLALRSELPNLKMWDRNLCAMVAEGRNAPQRRAGLLRRPRVRTLEDPSFLPKLLPARAIANARLGRVAEAQRDLAVLRKLRDAKTFSEAAFERAAPGRGRGAGRPGPPPAKPTRR